MRCRNCGATQPIGLSYVCPACFGPLEVDYDYAVASATLTRDAIAARAPGIWRYLELLPVDAPPARGLPVGSTPLLPADRLAPPLGLDRLLIKDDTRNPSLSFKDRAVAVAAARAVDFGVEALACASTGNLAGATAAAAAPRSGCPPTSSSRPTSSRPRSTTPSPTARRSCRSTGRTTTSTGCASRSPTRPAGASSTSTCARSTRKAPRRSPSRSPSRSAGGRPTWSSARSPRGRCSPGWRAASRSWPTLGLIERRPIRFVGGQASGCAPVATAWAAGTDVIEPVRTPDTIVRSLAIGNPADGRYVVELVNETGGSVEAIDDEVTAAAIRDVARLEGIYPETAGGVTLAAAAAARRRGVIRPGDEVVAC